MSPTSPDRIRRYLKRTMTPPPATYVLSLREREERDEWQHNWWRDENDRTPPPPVVEWHAKVRAYCKAKELGSPEITVQENRLDMSHTLRWEARR